VEAAIAFGLKGEEIWAVIDGVLDRIPGDTSLDDALEQLNAELAGAILEGQRRSFGSADAN
jgi:hypothetical protein